MHQPRQTPRLSRISIFWFEAIIAIISSDNIQMSGLPGDGWSFLIELENVIEMIVFTAATLANYLRVAKCEAVL